MLPRHYNIGVILRTLFQDDIITNATTSVHSPIKNLLDVNPSIGIDKLITAVGNEYLRTDALVLKDGGHKLLQKQMGFQFINPSEGWFPGMCLKNLSMIL